MSITYHERPGVYADYDASAVYATGAGAKTIAVIAMSGAQAGLYALSGASGIDSVFGAATQLAQLLHLAFAAGASKALAYPVAEDTVAAYQTAIDTVLAQKTASFCVIGSCELGVQTALKTAVEAVSAEKGECIGIVGMQSATDAQRIARAAALNSPRMVLVAPQVYVGSTRRGGDCAAASLAGVLAAQTDPAQPLHGIALPGLTGVDGVWTEQQLDSLLTGGVTPFEVVGGEVRVIRAVTTCTSVDGVADTTWRELSTQLVVDDVIPAVRSALERNFARAKNNAATRSAIRNQVVVELESRVLGQVIDSYENLTVASSPSDGTVCEICFSFAVTHTLNRIVLTAHISV